MSLSTIVALILALASTALTNIAYLREHDAAAALPVLSMRRPFQSVRLLLEDRSWLLGFAMETAGFLLYAAALALASLALVQTIGAGGIGVLAYLSARLTGRQLGRRELSGVILSVLGLLALAASLAGGSGKGGNGSTAVILLWLGASGAAAVFVLLLGRKVFGFAVAAALAGGLFFSIGDISTKVATQGGLRVLFVLTLVVGYTGGTALLQLGYQSGGALTVAGLATLLTNALPIAAGTVVLDEPVPPGAFGGVRVLAFAAVTAGAFLLARPDDPAATASHAGSSPPRNLMALVTRLHRVVVVGGGFGGLQAVLGLRRAPVEVTLVDRRNFHLFQPLTYQVATGALSPGEIAYPLRAIFKRHRNVRVLMAEVSDFDLQGRELHLHPVAGVPAPASIPYDTLIVAGGSRYSYFGHDDWSEYAAEVKSLESALMVRSRLLSAFEAAEQEADPERRAAWLTFVVVGAGPTGVEVAGQIAELARDTLRRDFRTIDPRAGRILLVEAAERVLTTFPPSLSAKAERSLQRLGVTVLTGRTVAGVDGEGVTIDDGSGKPERIVSRTVIWAAGVTASGLASRLSELTGAELDRSGRVTVEPDLTLPGHPEVMALGDMVRVRGQDGAAVVLPGVAPVAMQQGRYAAGAVRARLRGRDSPPFRYRDKGNLATIGRAAAVADIKGLKLSGFIAWATWLLVHLWYLIGFQNRILVLIRWSFSFATHGRGARLITESGAESRPAPTRD